MLVMECGLQEFGMTEAHEFGITEDPVRKNIVINPVHSRCIFTTRKAERTYRKAIKKARKESDKPNTTKEKRKKTRTVDLHCRTSREAIDKVTKILYEWGPEYNKINFIVGRGNHSENNIPVLRPLLCSHIVTLGPFEASVMSENCGIISVIRHDSSIENSIPITA